MEIKEEVIGKKRGACDSFSKKIIIGKVKITDTKAMLITFVNNLKQLLLITFL